MTPSRRTVATASALAASALTACGGGAAKQDDAASKPAATPRSELRGTPAGPMVQARPGVILDLTAVDLEVRGPDPAVIEAVGLEGTSPKLGRLGAVAVRSDTREDATVVGPLRRVWPRTGRNVRPVEGLKVSPGGFKNGRPAAPRDAINGPWTMHYGFRVLGPGRLKAGTAVIAYRQGNARRLLRVPLGFETCSPPRGMPSACESYR
jgi:hypothetical protein